MTEIEAVSLAREVINKYGADADKPSVKLAIALINGAHERDIIRAELKEAQLAVTRMLPWQKLSDAQEHTIKVLAKKRDDYKSQLDELTEAVILGPLKGKTAHDEIVALRAELTNAYKLLPGCLGEWTGGSGGHRKYAGGCKTPGVWDVGVGFVCDQHRSTKGGDDDAWSWEREREILIGLASPNIDGMDIAAERLMLMTAKLALVTAERDAALMQIKEMQEH